MIDVTAAEGSVIPMQCCRTWGGGGSILALWVAAGSVTVGGAYGSSNERALAHRRVLLEWREAVYVFCVHLLEFI